MKVYSAKNIREADQYTIENEPVASIDLMERASRKLVTRFVQEFPSPRTVKIFCGPGNNGGDGLAIARMLHKQEYRVKVYHLDDTHSSEDFRVNMERLKAIMPEYIHIVLNKDDFPAINDKDVLLDALFGSGLNKPLVDLEAALVKHLNDSGATIVSVDIPSGMFADKHGNGIVVNAYKVYNFQSPKLSLLLPEYAVHGERWDVLDIRLNQEFLSRTSTPFEVIDYSVIADFYKKRKRITHKGSYGHALLIAGSYGKAGAAVLSARAAIRAGAGLVTAYVPSSAVNILQVAVPEVMCLSDEEKHFVSDIPDTGPFSAIGIGPGIGKHKKTAKALWQLLRKFHSPLVLDADALNILSEHPDWLLQIPHNSILTPHIGEFRRLAGDWENDYERLELLRKFARKYKAVVVLKDAFTAIADPLGNVYFNIIGNSGMATGGSGDVLTGIITGLLAQGYSPLQSAILGVYVHGLAGNDALDKQSKESLVAGDIINHLGRAFKLIRQI